MRIYGCRLQVFFLVLLWLPGMLGCDSSSGQDAAFKEQVSLLQNQVKGWQEHYTRLLCLRDILDGLESLDRNLDEGLSLTSYQRKLAALDLLMESAACPDLDQRELTYIMECHHLAARVWEARNRGRGGALAEDYINKIYPLLRQFDYPAPSEINGELRQALADYALAAEPQARLYLEQVRSALNAAPTLAPLAAIANQVLWHEAHNKLQEYQNTVFTPPYPLQ